MSDEIVELLFSFFAGMQEPRFVRLVETWLMVGRLRQTDRLMQGEQCSVVAH